MKTNWKLSLLALLLLAFSKASYSQEYVEMMRDPNVNFYDVQASFNAYWADRPMEKGKGYKAFRRWEAYMEPRVYPTGNMTLPSMTYENFLAWETQQANSGVPKSVAGNWSALGPIGKPTGGGAGRVNFIRFDPTNSNNMFLGTPDGGLWKSTNGGTSWTTNTDQLTVIGCTDIVIDPTNTQKMFLATGDGDAGDSFSIGILKTTDGGATWVPTGSATVTWTASQGRTLSRMLINPNNPQIIMAFGSNGIYRSTDGGTTWTQPAGSFNGVMDAEFKPGDPNTVYAAGTVFKKSTDGGATWTTVSTGLTGIGRLAIAVTPADPTYVYVLAARGSDSGFLGLIRSTNSGTSFTTRMASTASNNILGWDNGADAGGQGWYDLAIAASPTNAEEVFTGGINIWRSTNGGTSFTLNAHWYGGYSKPYVHADIHDLVFLPGSGTTLYSGNDGGIFRTTNNGTSYTDLSSNLVIAQQYRVGNSASSATLLVTGHQDNGTNKMNGTTWSQIYGGDGMDCFIDRTNNNNIFASYTNGDYSRSTNGGGAWTSINTGLPAGDWVSPWHQDPVTATTLYAGGRSALYRSTNSGTNWSALGTPTGSGNITEFVISPSNNQIIYCIKSGANAVSKSTNGGTSFTSVSTGLPTGVMPTGIAVSNTDPNIVFVTYSGYTAASKVYKSTNGGTSWTNISAGLPNLPVNCIVFQNGSANDGIYIGTDVDVFYKDNSTAWVSFDTGLPNVSIRDLEIYYATGRLRAATFGRGTWDSDLYTSTPAVPVAQFTPSATTICAGQSVTFTNTSTGLPTSYLWTFAGGTPATSTATNPTVTYNTVGTYTVALTATNASGSNTNTQTNLITVVTSTGVALPLSEGFTSATFTPTNWTSTNTDLGATTWARSATVGFAPTAGNSMFFDNYSFDDSGNQDEVRTPKLSFTGLTSAQMTFDVSYAPYDAANFDGLEVLVSTDCGLNYTSVYSKSNTVLATSAATTASFVPTLATQWRTETIDLSAYIGQSSVTLAFRNLAGYGNNLYVDNINITGVLAPSVPVASFTSSPSSPVCTGQTVTFTNTSSGSPTSYSWTFTGGTPATSTLANPTVTYATAGTYTVAMTATNGAGSNTTTQTNYISIDAIPATPGTISGGSTICSGATGNVYSITAVPGATSYTWTAPAGATITAGQGTNSATITMGATSGNVTVTATNSCGTSPAATKAVTINSTPATPGSISGTAAVCSGSSGNVYSITAVPGATSYTWTAPAGATITAGQGTNSATITLGSTAGNVTVTASNTCGTSAAVTFAVAINTAPAIPGSITGSSSVCAGSTGNSYSIITVPGATNYTWSVPAGASITAGQGTTVATINLGATSGNITVTATNGCGTSAASIAAITVNAIPSAPSVSVVNNCGNSVLTASGAGSFTWSTGATTASITVPAGTFTVTQTVSGCTSTSASGIANPTPGPAVPTLTVTNNCGNSVLTTTAAGTLLWSTGESTGSITVTTAGNYSVSQTVAGCSSAPGSITAAPLTIPTAPVVNVIDSCGISLLSANTSGTVLWSTGATTPSIYASAGTYTLTQTVGGCTSPIQTAIATPFVGPAVTFTPLADVCINTPAFSLSGGSPAGGTYSGTGVTANQFDPSVAGYGTITITYSYTDGNGCADQSQQTIVVGCAGIEDLAASNALIYPNPTNGIFTISTASEVISSVSIYDGAGKLVAIMNNDKLTNEMNIDLSSFARGVYSLELQSEKSIARNRVILVD